jgi:esterase/lipase
LKSDGRDNNRNRSGSRSRSSRGGQSSRTQGRPTQGRPSQSRPSQQRSPEQRTSKAAPSRPAPKPAPAAASPVSPHTKTLTLSAWDMARTRRQLPDSPRGHVMTLRTHQRLVDSFEKERKIPDPDRSVLRVKEDSKGSCLLIHGVSTRPGDLHELADVMFDSDYNVYVLRLPDYGTPGHTISEVSWESCLYQARQCFQILARGGGKVHVVGLGFGATLALLLALEESVSSLVLLSPAIMPRESMFQRLVVRLKLHRLGFIHNWLGWNADLMEGMDKARGKIGKIRVPIYAAQCEDDDRASPASLRFLQNKVPNRSSRFQVFPEGGHAILAEHGKDVLYNQIIQFCGSAK